MVTPLPRNPKKRPDLSTKPLPRWTWMLGAGAAIATIAVLFLAGCASTPPAPSVTADQAKAEAERACAVYVIDSQARRDCILEFVRLRTGGPPDTRSEVINFDLQAAPYCTQIGFGYPHAQFGDCILRERSAYASRLRAASPGITPSPQIVIQQPSGPSHCVALTTGPMTTANCF